jgi:Uma2 family endonuclease
MRNATPLDPTAAALRQWGPFVPRGDLPMSTAPQVAPLLTAEQFARRPDPGYPEELVKGRIEPMPPTNRRHGQICNKVGRLLGNFAEAHDLGHVLNNDAGVITERGPDTVRGPDVAFYSYARLPRGPVPEDYGIEPPDLVIEVLSPSDRWPKVLAKAAEYLNAGVTAVIVLDPAHRSAHVHTADAPGRVLGPEDELWLPDMLGEFRVIVGEFFE